MKKEVIEFLIEGGKASPTPVLVKKIKDYGLNLDEILKKINEVSKEYEGIQIPIKLELFEGGYNIKLGTPSVSSLIKKELKVEKLKITEEDREKGVTAIGNLTMEQIVKIAKIKINSMLTKDLKKATKEIIGSCVSMPITIENKHPKEIIKEVENGKWDYLFE